MILDLLSKPPAKNSIHIWIVQLNQWISHSQHLKTLLSEKEITRVERRKIQEKQEELILSRGILRIIIGSYLDQEPADLKINSTPDGKPYLENSKLEFNLSHSGNIWICALCQSKQVGIDIQERYPITSIKTIIKNYFSVDEKNYLDSLPAGQYKDNFFSLWTAKEAYLKAIGKGFQESPTKISILPDASSGNYILDQAQSQQKSGEWTISAIDLEWDYSAAFAVLGQIDQIVKNNLTPDDYLKLSDNWQD